MQIHGIISIIDLLQCCPSQFLQLAFRAVLASLQFNEDAGEPSIQGLHLDVVAPQTGFPVGGDAVAVIQHGTQAQDQAVVKGFAGGIVEADGLQQECLQLPAQLVGVRLVDGLLDADGGSTGDDTLQLGEDLLAVDEGNLLVGQGYPTHVAAEEIRIHVLDLQIAGHQQEAVDGGGVALELGVDHIGVDVGREGLALHQQFQPFQNVRGGAGEDFPDDVIAAGGQPECFGAAVVAEISDDRPGIENVGAAEAVTVVPLANLLIFFRCIVVPCHLPHLVGGEAEIPAILLVQNGIDHQIVQAAEDTPLCHTEDTSEEAIAYVRIVLQTTGEEVAHEAGGLFVEAPHMSMMDGDIVLIDDDDGCHIVVDMEHPGQIFKGHGHICPVGGAVQILRQRRLFVLAQAATGQKLAVPLKFVAQELADLPVSLLPAFALHILEGHIYDGIAALVLAVLTAKGPDLLVPEIDGGILAGLFKENPEHIHVQGLAESPGASEQGHLGPFVQKFLDEHGLIHIIVAGAGRPVIGHADGQGLANTGQSRLRAAPSAVQRLIRIIRNDPLPSLLDCSGNSPRFAKLTHTPLRNVPKCGSLSNCHGDSTPLLVIENNIAVVLKNIKCIIPNNTTLSGRII